MMNDCDWWLNHTHESKSQRHKHLILRWGTRLHCRAVFPRPQDGKSASLCSGKSWLEQGGTHTRTLWSHTQTYGIRLTRACDDNMWKQGSHIPMGVAEKGIYPPNAFLFIGNMTMNHQTTSNWGGFFPAFSGTKPIVSDSTMQLSTLSAKHLAKGPVIPSVGDLICRDSVVSWFLLIGIYIPPLMIGIF